MLITHRAIQGVSTVHRMMKYESRIAMDLRNADIRTILTVILCLMVNGFDSAARISRYLLKRGCPYDRDEIQALLDLFEGGDPDFHLWLRHDFGDGASSYGLLQTTQELLIDHYV